jgi:hypothetical protein
MPEPKERQGAQCARFEACLDAMAAMINALAGTIAAMAVLTCARA